MIELSLILGGFLAVYLIIKLLTSNRMYDTRRGSAMLPGYGRDYRDPGQFSDQEKCKAWRFEMMREARATARANNLSMAEGLDYVCKAHNIPTPAHVSEVIANQRADLNNDTTPWLITTEDYREMYEAERRALSDDGQPIPVEPGSVFARRR